VQHVGEQTAGAVGRVEKSGLTELVVTDSIQPSDKAIASKKVRIVSVAALMGDAIWRVATDQSVSVLFE